MDRPQPWADCPQSALAGARGVITDIDDTLTREGALEPAARAALQALHDAGLPVLAITGRPLGWSESYLKAGPLAWPLHAIVAENGAVALIPEQGVVHVEIATKKLGRQCYQIND